MSSRYIPLADIAHLVTIRKNMATTSLRTDRWLLCMTTSKWSSISCLQYCSSNSVQKQTNTLLQNSPWRSRKCCNAS